MRAASSKSLLSHCSFKNLQGESAFAIGAINGQKWPRNIGAIEVSLLVYKVQGAILVPLTLVYHEIINFPAPVIWHCKISLFLKGTNISSCSNKTSDLIPEKQSQRKRRERGAPSECQGAEVSEWHYGATFQFRLLIVSPGNHFSIHPIIGQTSTRFYGGLGSLRVTTLRALQGSPGPGRSWRFCSSEAPRWLLPGQLSGRRCAAWLP